MTELMPPEMTNQANTQVNDTIKNIDKLRKFIKGLTAANYNKYLQEYAKKNISTLINTLLQQYPELKQYADLAKQGLKTAEKGVALSKTAFDIAQSTKDGKNPSVFKMAKFGVQSARLANSAANTAIKADETFNQPTKQSKA